MSVYKWRNGLPGAVRSVLQQTHSDFEFLIGTTDPMTEQYLGETVQDDRVSIRRMPVTKLYERMNVLFGMARGDYIAIIHDDDYYLPTFLETLLTEFRGDPMRYAFVSSGFIREDKDGTLAPSKGTHPLATLHHSVLYSRPYIDLLRKRDGHVWDERWEMASETDFMHRISSMGPSKHCGQWLYVYRTYTSAYSPFYRRFQNFIEGIEVAKKNGFRWPYTVLVRNFIFMFMQTAHYAGISWKGLGLEKVRAHIERWDVSYK